MDKTRLRTIFNRWLPAVIIMALIFIMSGTPSDALPDFGYSDLLVKKTGHMVGYALLAIAFIRGLGGNRSRDFAMALILTIIYASSDEIHQLFTPGRGGVWFDVLIDSAGGALGLLIWSKSDALKKFSKIQL